MKDVLEIALQKKYPFIGLHNARSIYPNIDSARILSDELFNYYFMNGRGMAWFIKNSKTMNIFEIHETFVDSFPDDLVDTILTTGIAGPIVLRRMKGFGVGYNVQVLTKHNRIEVCGYSSTLQIVKDRKMKEEVIALTNAANFYSDYPRHKKTGEIMDFSSFAMENRVKFNMGLRKFEEKLGGEIYKWGTATGKELPMFEEEIERYGYKALTERKEEYMLQKSQKVKI